MADGRDSTEIGWYFPEERGVIPLDTFHVPRSLARFMRHMPYSITMNKDFRAIITACAELNESRDATWINDEIIDAYCELHQHGHAHSVEVWDNKQLIGGLYGVCLGRAFFGESMFSRKPNASKVALVHLVRFLKLTGYKLLDAQYVNEHLLQFGIRAVPQEEYLVLLKDALGVAGDRG